MILTEEKRLYSVNEAAEQLGISRSFLYELMNIKDPKKRINYVMVGKRRRVKVEEIDRYLNEN